MDLLISYIKEHPNGFLFYLNDQGGHVKFQEDRLLEFKSRMSKNFNSTLSNLMNNNEKQRAICLLLFHYVYDPYFTKIYTIKPTLDDCLEIECNEAGWLHNYLLDYEVY